MVRNVGREITCRQTVGFLHSSAFQNRRVRRRKREDLGVVKSKVPPASWREARIKALGTPYLHQGIPISPATASSHSHTFTCSRVACCCSQQRTAVVWGSRQQLFHSDFSKRDLTGLKHVHWEILWPEVNTNLLQTTWARILSEQTR